MKPLGVVTLLALAACGGDVTSDSFSGYQEVGADRLYYETMGAGEPLVLVSGGSGMDVRQWDAVSAELAGAYFLVRVDPRGVGRSDNPTEPYTDASDLAGLLDALAIPRVTLIGQSSSGGFVLEFAVRYPERVKAVVAAAPFIPGFEFSAAMTERLQRIGLAAGEGREPFLDAMFGDSYFFPAPLDPDIREPSRDNMGRNYDKQAGFDPVLPIPFEPPLIERLDEVPPVPVLLLEGGLDHPEVFRRNRFIESQIATAEIAIVPDAGHNPHLENPVAYLDKVRSFLAAAAAP